MTYLFFCSDVWGYNEEVVKYVQEENDKDKEGDGNGISNDSVTNRVAGMTLKATFTDHKDAVSGVTCFFRENNHWMVWLDNSSRLNASTYHYTSSVLGGIDVYACMTSSKEGCMMCFVIATRNLLERKS
jgi:hypothetical protein